MHYLKYGWKILIYTIRNLLASIFSSLLGSQFFRAVCSSVEIVWDSALFESMSDGVTGNSTPSHQ